MLNHTTNQQARFRAKSDIDVLHKTLSRNIFMKSTGYYFEQNRIRRDWMISRSGTACLGWHLAQSSCTVMLDHSTNQQARYRAKSDINVLHKTLSRMTRSGYYFEQNRIRRDCMI